MRVRATMAGVLLVTVLATSCVIPPAEPDGPWVLLFTRTEGFVHDSVGPAAQALGIELHDRGYGVIATDNPALFTPDRLAVFDVVVFLSTTGDVLDPPHEAALRAWVEDGGGWVGVHSALDTEYGWPFYATLAGTRFASHPATQPATVHVEDGSHPATAHLPASWARTDEWYDTQANPRPGVQVLATVDESTYSGGGMGSDHPIAWCDEVGGGQTFVTAMGHTSASWHDAVFVDHVVGGIESVRQPGSCT
jgi:type 1 glutamine amidotransferase